MPHWKAENNPWRVSYLILALFIIFLFADRYKLKSTGGVYGSHGSGVWLGATDEAVEGSFVWQPVGTPMIFSDWDVRNNQPDDRRQQIFLVYLHDPKKWHDVPCDNFIKTCICEG